MKYKEKSGSKSFKLVWISQLIFTIIYLLASILPILVIEGDVEGNILLEIDGISGFILQLTSCLGVLISLSLIYLPLLFRSTLELLSVIKKFLDYIRINFPASSEAAYTTVGNTENNPGDFYESKEFRFGCYEFIMFGVISLGCYLISVLVGDGFQIFMGLAGCIAASSVMFIFPGIIYSKYNIEEMEKISKPVERIRFFCRIALSYIIMGVGVVVAISGTLWTFKVSLVADYGTNSTIPSVAPIIT